MLRLIIGALSVCLIINTFALNRFLIIYIVLSTNVALQFTRVLYSRDKYRIGNNV